MRAAIREHLDAGGDLLLDLAELTFLDVAVARTLAEPADVLALIARLVLEGPWRGLERVLRLCGWGSGPASCRASPRPRSMRQFGPQASA